MRSQDQSVSLNHDCTLKQKSVSMPKELPSVSSIENPPQKQTNQQKPNANKNRVSNCSFLSQRSTVMCNDFNAKILKFFFHQGQQNQNSTGGPSKSTSRVASTDTVPPNQQNSRSVTPKASEQAAESVPKPLESVVPAVSKTVAGNSTPKSASSTTVVEPAVASKPTVEGKLTPKEIISKVNVAQMFVPLKGVSVPSSVQQSNSYMENCKQIKSLCSYILMSFRKTFSNASFILFYADISQLTTLKEKGKVSIHRVA